MEIEKSSLFEYTLRLGDTALILSHRLSEWCGHGPMLEEDIAMSNMALDLIGQSRLLLSYAGSLEGNGRTEDDLAYHRDNHEFRNLLLAEQPNTDFAVTMVRQHMVSLYQQLVYSELINSKDATLAGIAEKSLKEVLYHVRHAGDWIKRLGDGTPESHERAQDAVNDLWYYTGDIFQSDEVDDYLLEHGIGVDMKKVKAGWEKAISELLTDATLSVPNVVTAMHMGSRKGNHTEHLGYILAEMQFLPRAYPDAKW